MENNISTIITQQHSEYTKTNHPLFVGFMNVYYEYMQQRTKAMGLVQNRALDFDIDNTLELYISEFFKTYAEFLPRNPALSEQNFIKFLNDVYNAKGTEKSLKLIFRLLYNEEIQIRYPSEKILKASDGIWEFDNFITVINQFGSLPTDKCELLFTNKSGSYKFEVVKFEVVDSSRTRFYFKSYEKIIVDENQIINIVVNGELIYYGQVERSPSNIKIINRGKNWQKGQVIKIDGAVKDTILRVNSVDSIGGITDIEILEYGFPHENDQTSVVSPYTYKPISSLLDVTSNLISRNPDAYHHNVTVNDYIDGVTESLVGLSDVFTKNSYFLEDYVSSGYVGDTVISKSTTAPSNENLDFDYGLSIGEWLSSRSTLVYETNNIVKTKGRYKTENGQISNQEIKIQDNYYYQPFSYIVESTKDINDYKSLLNITHPAGTKLFANLIKTSELSVDASCSRTLSIETINLLDSVLLNIGQYKHYGKSLNDVLVIDSSVNVKSLNKNGLMDAVSIFDGDSQINYVTYNLDDYFEESYVATNILIEIG